MNKTDHRAAGTTGGYDSHAGAPGLPGTTGGYGSTHTAGSTGYGPHDSKVANKLDPRFDSDLDHRGAQGTGTHGTHTGTHGTHTGTHTGAGTGAYGTSTTGAYGAGAQTGEYGSGLDTRGTHGTTTHGTHGTHGTTGTTGAGYGSGNHGPHDAPVLNKLDPRFDSDRDHRAAGTSHMAGSTGAYGSGTTGEAGYGTHDRRADYGSSTGTAGTTGHGVHDTHGTHGTHGTHTGPAPNTAGPHKSDMLNKLDPRVDSNLDGSQTMGGDKTIPTGPHA